MIMMLIMIMMMMAVIFTCLGCNRIGKHQVCPNCRPDDEEPGKFHLFLKRSSTHVEFVKSFTPVWEWKMLSIVVQLSTKMQTHSSCLVKSLKIFYSSITCDFCDKFHACKKLCSTTISSYSFANIWGKDILWTRL